MNDLDDERGQRWVNFVGAGGEFLVASMLSQRGYIPAIPLVDEGYDFFVFDPVNDSFKKVQVKASRAKSKDFDKTKYPKKHEGEPWAGQEYWKHQISVRCGLIDKDVPGLVFVFLLLTPDCDEKRAVTVVVPQSELKAKVDKKKVKRAKKKQEGQSEEDEDVVDMYNVQLRMFPGKEPRVFLNGTKPTNPNLSGYINAAGIEASFPKLDLTKKAAEAADLSTEGDETAPTDDDVDEGTDQAEGKVGGE